MIEVTWAHTMNCPFLAGGKCAGSGCMGWRWFEETPEPITIDHVDPLAEVEPEIRPKDIPRSYKFYGYDVRHGDNEAFWSESDESAENRRKGYCGAFGKPEIAE